jgi:hypothetical protein
MTSRPRDTQSAESEESLRQRSFAHKAEWHRAQAALPLRRKVEILLELQRQDLPLIAQRRALRPWERPWEIEP